VSAKIENQPSLGENSFSFKLELGISRLDQFGEIGVGVREQKPVRFQSSQISLVPRIPTLLYLFSAPATLFGSAGRRLRCCSAVLVGACGTVWQWRTAPAALFGSSGRRLRRSSAVLHSTGGAFWQCWTAPAALVEKKYFSKSHVFGKAKKFELGGVTSYLCWGGSVQKSAL